MITRFYLGLTTKRGESVRDINSPAEVFEEFLQKTVPGVSGFTVTDGRGYYQGIPEDCLIFEVISDKMLAANAAKIAMLLASAFEQETVLYVMLPAVGALIDEDGARTNV